MFLYAKESTYAEEVVRNLLSENGPFYNINGYSDRGGGNFFLILSLINPGSAIKAVSFARQGNNAEAMTNRKTAIEKDAAWNAYAKDDCEFLKMRAELPQ